MAIGAQAVVVVAAVLAGLAPAPGAVEPALATRLRGIESAFKSGDAALLRPAFTGDGKVRVDLKNVMAGPGSYGPGQLKVIFDRIFDENLTREFTFRDEDVTESAGVAFARGRWVHKVRPGGTVATDTLTFTLRQEGGDWRIHEIRSSR
ncbi:MAG TPA: nuclear transport factor 2 family protein [Vicinamibacteria bacterium]|nr:nuclear transport factor 2 family protein [Vicinamibacteria bacterium]